jgi:hypothetical protein
MGSPWLFLIFRGPSWGFGGGNAAEGMVLLFEGTHPRAFAPFVFRGLGGVDKMRELHGGGLESQGRLDAKRNKKVASRTITRRLTKSSFPPPPLAFPPVWTLYVGLCMAVW